MDCLENMGIYNKLREVPENAQKQIGAGRLKGMTDINPMWRIARLTEMFGPVGVGWYYKVVRKWTEDGAGDEKCAFVDIELYIKYNGEWSAPIEGTGGSMLVTQERSGLHTSDEAYKMALTDAISVACKALGMGANVYWAAGRQTKYDTAAQSNTPPVQENVEIKAQYMTLFNKFMAVTGYDEPKMRAWCEKGVGKREDKFTTADYNKCCAEIEKRLKAYGSEAA